MTRVSVTDEQELTVRRQAEEVVRRVLEGTVSFSTASPRLQSIIEGRESAPTQGAKPDKRKRDLAEVARQWFQTWYRTLGFTDVLVPKPAVSNREFARRAKLGESPFYRPPTTLLPYEGFMTAVGQGNHWTVTDEANRAQIGWEPAKTGYWFWAEVMEDCPRLGTSWNDLMKTVRLISLEEYVILWYVTKFETNKMPDHRYWSWLRTRFGASALGALGYGGGVCVSRWCGSRYLAVPGGGGGGRAVEVIG